MLEILSIAKYGLLDCLDQGTYFLIVDLCILGLLQDAAASARKAEASRKRAEDIAAGIVQMNGRELFEHEPWVFDNSLY